MRLLSRLIILLVIIACNNNEKAKEDKKDTAKQQVQMPVSPSVPDTIFTGAGTEPFWSVYVINNSKIVFHPVNSPDIELPFVAPTISGTTQQYNSTGGNDAIEITINKKDCSDGMSEIVHPYEVSVILNKIKYSGCGREGN